MTKNKEENEKLKKLFKDLDKNGDGKIDFNELQEYFNELKKKKNSDFSENNEAQALFDSITKTENKKEIDLRDFIDFINEKDKKIELIFKDLDKDGNGMIDREEIKEGFEKMGIILSEKQIEKLLLNLDKNGSCDIDLKEFQNFFRFAPHDKIEEMLRYWRTNSFVDYADQSIPNDYTIKEKKSGLWWRNLLAGGLAGAISRTSTAPLDRVKIFLQVHGTGAKSGIIGSIKNMVKEGGLSSLWRGNFINVLKITPESAIKFTAYEQIKILMGQEGVALKPFEKFFAGTMAGFIAQSTIYPMEVLKTRLALRKTGQYDGIFDCIRKIYKGEGIKAFYRGYLMNTLGIAGVGIDFAIYETLKSQYKSMFPDTLQPSTLALILIANTSSTTAMYTTYPLFLIRTRMQSSNNPKETIFSIARYVYSKDGIRGFYRGAFANLAKVAPSSSIGYLTYEYVSQLLGTKQ